MLILQVNKIRLENDKKEADLKASHSEVLKKMLLQAGNELKEVRPLIHDECMYALLDC